MKEIFTNKQRPYFGLKKIESQWDEVKLSKTVTAYFEGDVIKKTIECEDQPNPRFFEFDYALPTKEREFLLPKTKRGKPQKLTASLLQKRFPDGTALYWSATDSTGHVTVKSFPSLHIIAQTYRGENILTHDQLRVWIEKWIDESPAEEIERVRGICDRKRETVQYQAGDVFAFPVSRQEYGFGRILFSVPQLVQKKVIPKGHFLVMGKPVCVEVFSALEKTTNTNIQAILGQKTSRTFFLMDDDVFYGRHPIVGHAPIQLEEVDMPMTAYCTTDMASDDITLSFIWGIVKLEQKIETGGAYCSELPGHFSTRKGIPWTRQEIMKAMQKKHALRMKHGVDLRDTQYTEIRKEIFKVFDLPENSTYAEFLRRSST